MSIKVSQKTLLNAFLVIAAMAAISGALALLLRNDSNPGIEIVLPTPTPTPELKVHISGAVRSPGVYTFQDGDRLQDVVNAAGGLLPEADPSAVNLAERMRDEGHSTYQRSVKRQLSPQVEQRARRPSH